MDDVSGSWLENDTHRMRVASGNIPIKCGLLEEYCSVLKKARKNIALVLIPVDKSVDKWGIVWINGGNVLR